MAFLELAPLWYVFLLFTRPIKTYVNIIAQSFFSLVSRLMPEMMTNFSFFFFFSADVGEEKKSVFCVPAFLSMKIILFV